MKITTWNVNGIRAIMNKDFKDSVLKLDSDIICLQETKAQEDQTKAVLETINGYYVFANSAVRKGYSSTAIMSKTEPIRVFNDIGIEEHDQEGRIITAEYEKFFLVTAYVPNSGSELVRLDYREKWDQDLLSFLKKNHIFS